VVTERRKVWRRILLVDGIGCPSPPRVQVYDRRPMSGFIDDADVGKWKAYVVG
jgi:hypothetical protein